MSFILKIDPTWYAERVIAGKSDEEMLAEIIEMIDASMRREGERVLQQMKEMLRPTPNTEAD